jgi:hypothetical protein
VKRRLIFVAVLLAAMFAALSPARAQDPIEASLNKLEEKASKTVDVSLDQSMLKFASVFLNDKDADQAKAKKIIAKLRGIYVHNFEFEKDGGYSPEDLIALRVPLKGPEWSRIVNVRSKHNDENVEVYFRKVGGQFQGLVVIATQPTQLTYVNIDGEIDPDELMQLGGQFGIPRVDLEHSDKDKEKDKEKEKDKKGEDN